MSLRYTEKAQRRTEEIQINKYDFNTRKKFYLMPLHLLRVFFVPSAVKHFGILHDISLCGECSNRFDKNVISSGFLKRINPDGMT